MKGRVLIAGMVLFPLLAGCTESVMFRSLPPGATVTVNNQIIGNTPVEFSTPSKSLGQEPFRYRIEADGYRPVEGVLKEYVGGGRVVGCVFTFGILSAFRSVKTFGDRPVEVVLESVETPGSAHGTDSIEQRLNQLKDLHDRGVISDEEYKRARGDVLRTIAQ